MDDRTVGRAQARLMRTTLLLAGVSVGELWWKYFSCGGEVSELEVDAFLHHALYLPPRQRDRLAQAVNVLVVDASIPNSWDFGPVDDQSEE